MREFEQIIEPLLKKIEEKEKELVEIKKAVNQLCVVYGKEVRYSDNELTVVSGTTAILPDQFFGKPLATSVRSILLMKGSAMTAKEIEEKLKQGGYEYPEEWKDNQLKNLGITLGKNSSMIATLRNNNITLYGLLDWYPDEKKKRDKKKSNSEKRESDDNKPSISLNREEEITDSELSDETPPDTVSE